MIRMAKLKRMVTSSVAEAIGLGGVTQNKVISPKGLYSKPKKEKAIVIPIMDGQSQDFILAIQKDTEGMEEGDVRLTDDKSYIHFSFNGSSIEVVSDKVTFKTKEMIIESATVEFKECTVTNDGIPIGNTHTHTQKAGLDGYGAGNSTLKPDP